MDEALMNTLIETIWKLLDLNEEPEAVQSIVDQALQTWMPLDP
jgi:hypothetical protein